MQKNVTGSRVIDLNCLSAGIQQISTGHNKTCKGECKINREVRREGLASVLEVTCDSCTMQTFIESSTRIAGSEEIKGRYSVNVGAVWGQMATGGGQSGLNELLSSVNVPCMTKKTFCKIEEQIGRSWEKILSEEIINAGVKERDLAIEKNDRFQRLPSSVTVAGLKGRINTVLMQNLGLL